MKHVLFSVKRVLFLALLWPALAPAQIVESRTPEGLTVWVAPRPGLPRVTALLLVRGGATLDPKGLPGMSEVLAYALTEGTTSHSAREIAEAAQAAGGELRADWAADAITLEASGLSDSSGSLLKLLAEVAMRPSFPAAEVELVKSNMAQQLAERESTPDFIGAAVFARALFGEHPYGVTHASRKVIEAVTPSLLRDEHARRFRPDRALLVVVGDLDAAAVVHQAAEAFAGWRAPSGTAEVPLPSPAPRDGRRILLVDRPDSTQSHILVGRLAPMETDPRFFPALVGNLILGGMGSGRIMENLREDKGWAYTPSSHLLSLERAGVLQVMADVRTEVTAPALLEAFYELDRMWSAPPSDDELKRAKRFAAGAFLVRTQVHDRLAEALARYWLMQLPPKSLEQYVERLNAVTLPELNRVCEALFPSLRQTVVVVVGDAAKLQPLLERLGAVSVVKP
jgi:predicted Zn-dependent peptidase